MENFLIESLKYLVLIILGIIARYFWLVVFEKKMDFFSVFFKKLLQKLKYRKSYLNFLDQIENYDLFNHSFFLKFQKKKLEYLEYFSNSNEKNTDKIKFIEMTFSYIERKIRNIIKEYYDNHIDIVQKIDIISDEIKEEYIKELLKFGFDANFFRKIIFTLEMILFEIKIFFNLINHDIKFFNNKIRLYLFLNYMENHLDKIYVEFLKENILRNERT